MTISKLSIYNFRSIEKIENLTVTSFNVFVGQNNHGKTNIFEAIEWFYNGGDENEMVRNGASRDSVYVDIEFQDAQSGLERVTTATHKTKIKNTIGENEIIRVRRRLNDVKKVYYVDAGGSEVDFGTGIANSLLDFFPKLQFVKTEATLKEVAKYGRKTPMSEMLSDVLEQILEDETGSLEYAEFKEKFNKLFGQGGAVGKGLLAIGEEVKTHVNKQFKCDEISFMPALPTFDDIFKNTTTRVNDGIETTAEEKGDGMQRAIMLGIIQTYADYRRKKENSTDFIFLIDEGELHLHPTAQRSLKNALLELSASGDQVFITSHSSVLIADESLDQKLFRVEKIEYKTQVSEISNFEKQDVVFDLLGGSPKDLLLPNNFMIVEGECEYRFLSNVIQNYYLEEKKIKILRARGDIDQTIRLASALEKLFTPINESIYQKTVVILLDKLSDQKISEGSYKELLQKFPVIDQDRQVSILPVGNLEEYYPVAKDGQAGGHNDVPKWKRAETEISAMNSQQKVKLAEVVGAKIKKEQFEKEMPVVYEALRKCWDNAY